MTHPKQESVIAIDFETYSAAPLPSVGLANYVADPTFMPTLVGVAEESGTYVLDFVLGDPDEITAALRRMLTNPGAIVVAHNAGFEQAVLRTLDIDVPVQDSAVVAAVAGADRHLANAARQLLDEDKLDADGKLLRLFAMPQKDQPSLDFDRRVIDDNLPEWLQFIEYCRRDATLARRLYIEWCGDGQLHAQEMANAAVTLRMNQVGWPLDRNAAATMLERYRENLEMLQENFAASVDPDLNLASHMQVSRWCADRGVTSRSFDKTHVDKLIAKLERKTSLTPGQSQVLEMLRTKRELGGSSPKKLETILDTEHEGRIYDQYVHAGAAQTLRTSGRSVQMQNLPRLTNVRDMATLSDVDVEWDNDDLAGNLRQLFRAEHPQGQLIVADYASIESRALAWLADEKWKLDTYRRGEDVYKMQAVKIFDLPTVDLVDKSQRQTGKVGELSCGYGAGPGAVKDFAEKMGVALSEAEAKSLVYDWRDANPRTVGLWRSIHDALLEVVSGRSAHSTVSVGEALHYLEFSQTETPASLTRQAKNDGLDANSVQMVLRDGRKRIMRRVFHGCYLRGNNVGYYKASSLKNGDPWKLRYTDPKTGLVRRYELYGGKVVGILTQSLCREIFFRDLREIDRYVAPYENVSLIGQFHDEVILEWAPGRLDLSDLLTVLDKIMSFPALIPGLPMAVEVKHARPYVK